MFTPKEMVVSTRSNPALHMNTFYKIAEQFNVFDHRGQFIICQWTQPKLVIVKAIEPILIAHYNFNVFFFPEENTKKKKP